MRPNLCPPEGAIGRSRQETDSVREISLAPQENIEERVLRRNDGAGFGVVADALAICESGFRSRGRARVVGHIGDRTNKIGHIRSPV